MSELLSRLRRLENTVGSYDLHPMEALDLYFKTGDERVLERAEPTALKAATDILMAAGKVALERRRAAYGRELDGSGRGGLLSWSAERGATE